MEMDDGARKWLIKTAAKNLWRLRGTYELEDLIQEGYLLWFKLVKKYHVTERAHQMRLFTSSYTNHLHYLARRASRMPMVHVDDLSGSDEAKYLVWDSLLGEDPEIATLYTAINESPKPVQDVFKLLTTDKGCRQLRSLYRYQHGKRETLNDRLRRLVGANPSVLDLPKMVKACLRGTS